MTYIELRTPGAPRSVKSDHLRAQEILPILDALGDMDDLVPLAVYDRVRRPGTPLEAFPLDVEPSQGLADAFPAPLKENSPAGTRAWVRRSVVHLLQVREHWALMARVHDVSRSSCKLC